MSEKKSEAPKQTTTPTDDDAGTSWPSSAKTAVLALALALLAALVVVTVLVRQDDDDPADDTGAGSDSSALQEAESGAEKAAREAVVQMTTYDYRTVEQDFDWVDDAGTDDFQTYFAKSQANTEPLIRKLKVIAAGKVVDAAAKAQDPDHAQVLLFVDQTIRVAGKQGTKIDQPRVTMDMVRQDGAWLVDKVSLNDLIGTGSQ